MCIQIEKRALARYENLFAHTVAVIRLHLSKKNNPLLKCQQTDFLANGADLIDINLINKTTVEILFCLMSTLENCLYLAYLL